jgi:hypothetical protein
MKAEYIELTDGRKVRILWNMIALGAFTALTGKELTDLEKPDVKTLLTIAWCAAKEGEEADGRELELNEKEFGRMMSMACVVSFSQILANQASITVQKKSEPPKKSWKDRIHLR